MLLYLFLISKILIPYDYNNLVWAACGQSIDKAIKKFELDVTEQ